MPDAPAEGDRAHPGDRRASSRSSSSAASPTRSSGDVYFRVATLPRVRPALGAAARPGRGAGAEPAQGGPARLRALEGEQARRGHAPGTRRGAAAGPAGTSSARRWPRSCSGPSFEIHGGGLDLVFPHHENELAQSRALGHDVRADLGAQRHARSSPARRCRSRSGTSRRSASCSTAGGARRCSSSSSPGTGASRSTSPTRRWQQAAAQAESFREVFRSASVPAAGGDWERFAAALDDDFNTPEALAVLHGWRDHELLRRGLEVFGLGVARGARRGAARGGRAGRAPRWRRGRRATSTRPDRLRGRDRGGGLGDA